ncbi:MAG: hypothetical protein QM534_01695 [Sediminibacterium sp.]|nr:hypothetical protein [Sediminibacterium sp.]
MKQIIALTFILFAQISLAQQDDKTPELNCYNKWAAKFEERGANEVADGIYTDVIITNRQGSQAKCFDGKAEVKNGKLVKFYILLDDNTYDEVAKTWKNKSNENVNIINGISKTMITVHNELFNVLWPKKIKAKKAQPKKAAEPADD